MLPEIYIISIISFVKNSPYCCKISSFKINNNKYFDLEGGNIPLEDKIYLFSIKKIIIF